MSTDDQFTYRVKTLSGETKLLTRAQIESVNDLNRKLNRKPIEILEVIPNT